MSNIDPTLCPVCTALAACPLQDIRSIREAVKAGLMYGYTIGRVCEAVDLCSNCRGGYEIALPAMKEKMEKIRGLSKLLDIVRSLKNKPNVPSEYPNPVNKKDN